jgi:hypothetical protein
VKQAVKQGGKKAPAAVHPLGGVKGGGANLEPKELRSSTSKLGGISGKAAGLAHKLTDKVQNAAHDLKEYAKDANENDFVKTGMTEGE